MNLSADSTPPEDYFNRINMKCESPELEAMYKSRLVFREQPTAYYKGDSGIDLFFDRDIIVPAGESSFMIDLKVACEAFNRRGEPSSFWLLPRSSLGKTPLRLANSIGLIDASYRGNLMVIVDNVGNKNFGITKGDKLFQIAMPDLASIQLRFTDHLSITDRGSRGFGSTNDLPKLFPELRITE